ncbi:hypothetical protein ACSMXM_13810 [Pacificimonas sp. ICDLI1SI03]|tara:strand:+ start:311 stop:718 length:408 start_codon:yes stop_codon:yes gene_type:complete
MMRKSKSKMTAAGLAPVVGALFFLAGCDESRVSAPDAQTPITIGTVPSAATASLDVEGPKNSSDANRETQSVTAGTSPESMGEASTRPRSGNSRAAPVTPILPADASAVTPTAEHADPHAGHDMRTMPDHDMKDM